MCSIVVIMTCHNRCEMTVACIRSLAECGALCCSFIVVDDNSGDSTLYELEILKESGLDITVLRGDGSLYYSGGMRQGISYAIDHTASDYYLLVNDDVRFLPQVLEKMIITHENSEFESGKVIVGCTRSDHGEMTYGGVIFDKHARSRIVGPEEDINCDTFCANCVLIPRDVFFSTPNIDPVYIHTLGDYDYGLSISRSGIRIKTFDDYVGICNSNDIKGTWMDITLGLCERIKLKESVKGAPFRQWFYFLRKNFGIFTALVHAFTPYIRIILRK
ncbi:MAG: glycosyltransferase family 2 protein [Lachnospiraceae bacterium]|nr:glycosyltransferase family 2 protein [Lachnospiraceae bacterium]